MLHWQLHQGSQAYTFQRKPTLEFIMSLSGPWDAAAGTAVFWGPGRWTWKLVAPLSSSRAFFTHPAMNFPRHYMALPVLPCASPVMAPLWGDYSPGKLWRTECKDGSKNKGMAKTQLCSSSFPTDSCSPANVGPTQMCLVTPLLRPKRVSEKSLQNSLCSWLGGKIFSQESSSRKIKNQTKTK